MKIVTKLTASKASLVIIDPELNKLRHVVFFPEKVEKARQSVARLGLPKQVLNEKA